MSYPPDVLNPDSLADVLKKSAHQSPGEPADNLGALVELLVMYIPLEQYDKVLDEWAAQPEGKSLHDVVREVVDGEGG